MNEIKVAVLGASDNPKRYSYKAYKMLESHGLQVLLISPRLDEIEGHRVYHDLSEIEHVDTLAMYVSAQISTKLLDKIKKLNPRRVIFNPGSENPDLDLKLQAHGILTEHACTLVLLSTGQF